jgi:ribose transport system permease protein
MQRPRINLGLDRFSGLYLWALFIVVFSFWSPNLFPTAATVHQVASQDAILAILGIALVAPLAAGAYDLSIGATTNMAAIVAVWAQSSQHWSVGVSIAIAIGGAAGIGVLNGFLVVKLHLSSLIATLGVASVVAAIQTIVSDNNQPVPPTNSTWLALTQTRIAGFPVVLLYTIGVAIVVAVVMDVTPAGRYIRVVGSNPEAARLSGVAVDKWLWVSLVMSSTLAGLAGVLYASYTGPSLTFGPTLLLPAFAAAFLGSTQLRPGRFNVWGTLLAVYVLATGIEGLSLVTSAQWLNDMFNGIALIGAVSLAVWRQRAGTVRKRRTKAEARTAQPATDQDLPPAVPSRDRTEIRPAPSASLTL